MLHEVGHLNFKFGTQGSDLEPLIDVTYCDGTACVDLANNDEDAALTNADNWAFAALNVSCPSGYSLLQGAD